MNPSSPPAPPPTNYNFAQDLLRRNASHPTRLALIDDHNQLSYGELAERVRRMASGLQSLGLRREERVALLMHDHNDWVVGFLGALYAGIVPVCLNTLLTPEDYAFMLRHCRAQAALVSHALLPTLQTAMAQGANEIQHVLVSHPTQPLPASTAYASATVDDLCARSTALDTPAPTLADEAAFWLYSSGSTGHPKGTVHTHGNLHWTAALYAQPVLGLKPTDIVFSAAKLFFAYGLGNALTFPLTVGATAVLMAERPTPQAVFKRLRGQTTTLAGRKPTVFYGAPTGYGGMLAHADLPSKSELALRLCSSAGEALPRDIGERWSARFGAEIIDGIGSTEMLHIFLSNRPGDVRYGSTGKAVPGYQVELRDEEGRPMAPNADGSIDIGALYVQGPSAALMYWNNREKTRDTFQGAWVKSGDKYSRDADGYYTYAGRNDDMLKVSGIYVSPFEVEATSPHVRILVASIEPGCS